MEYLPKNDNETIKDYTIRLGNSKEVLGLTWSEIAAMINAEYGLDLHYDTYRKRYNKYISECEDAPEVTEMPQDDGFEEVLTENIDKWKKSDEKVQLAAYYRRISREETIKEIAKQAAADINTRIPLGTVTGPTKKNDLRTGILLLGDWHYGITIDNIWNTYNPEIARDRLGKLYDETVARLKENNVTSLKVVNLGDLISGRIHQQIRLSNRIDVITQIMQVSELLAEFLYDLAADFRIDYYDTMDNHSRIEPNLKDSLDLESLCRITTWFLKERLGGIITVHDNTVSDDIATFKVYDHKVIAVHGDKDKPELVIKNLTALTQNHFDLVLTAHLHHVASDEENMTRRVENGSLMGTDEYAFNLRKISKPSQTLLIATPQTPLYCQYIIDLD